MAWTREWVERCEECAASTPHSRRRLAWPRALGLALGTASVAGFVIGMRWLPGAAAFVALWVLLREREHCWAIRCERCRAHRVAEWSRTRLRFGSWTEIFWV